MKQLSKSIIAIIVALLLATPIVLNFAQPAPAIAQVTLPTISVKSVADFVTETTSSELNYLTTQMIRQDGSIAWSEEGELFYEDAETIIVIKDRPGQLPLLTGYSRTHEFKMWGPQEVSRPRVEAKGILSRGVGNQWMLIDFKTGTPMYSYPLSGGIWDVTGGQSALLWDVEGGLTMSTIFVGGGIYVHAAEQSGQTNMMFISPNDVTAINSINRPTLIAQTSNPLVPVVIMNEVNQNFFMMNQSGSILGRVHIPVGSTLCEPENRINGVCHYEYQPREYGEIIISVFTGGPLFGPTGFVALNGTTITNESYSGAGINWSQDIGIIPTRMWIDDDLLAASDNGVAYYYDVNTGAHVGSFNRENGGIVVNSNTIYGTTHLIAGMRQIMTINESTMRTFTISAEPISEYNITGLSGGNVDITSLNATVSITETVDGNTTYAGFFNPMTGELTSIDINALLVASSIAN